MTADPKACVACEGNSCGSDVVPGCTKYAAGSSDRTRCEAVLTCIRSTGCVAKGSVDCYCGSNDAFACMADANAKGVCKDAIAAAFPAGSNAATVVNGLNDLSTPGGTALALGDCDAASCGGSCVPYCKSVTVEHEPRH